jgi:tetratricopeptide (TPR) repeat protein
MNRSASRALAPARRFVAVNSTASATRVATPCRSRYNTRFFAMSQTQNSRRAILEGFVAAKPDDAFARYGLALECAKLGDDPAALAHFEHLLATHPSYVAAYFHYGQLLARLGRTDEARKVLTAGILAAQNAGDSHARDEAQAALQALG